MYSPAASRVRFTDGTEESASGRLDVTPCYSPNTFYAYRIDSVEIVTASIAIRSAELAVGFLEAVTLYPEERAVTFSASVSINGQSDHLGGSGPLDQMQSGDTLELDLDSTSFHLALKAVRRGPMYERGIFNWCFPLPN